MAFPFARQMLKDSKADNSGKDELFFLDKDGNIQDKLIEDMYDICFYGNEITELFKHDFKLYCELLLGKEIHIPDNIFTDVEAATF